MSSDNDGRSHPGQVMSDAHVRILKFIVIALGILLILGFFVVIGTIFYRLLGAGGTPDRTPVSSVEDGVRQQGAVLNPNIDVAIGTGRVVQRMTLSGDRLAIHTKSERGDEIVIVDLVSGKVLSRVRLQAQ